MDKQGWAENKTDEQCPTPRKYRTIPNPRLEGKLCSLWQEAGVTKQRNVFGRDPTEDCSHYERLRESAILLRVTLFKNACRKLEIARENCFVCKFSVIIWLF